MVCAECFNNPHLKNYIDQIGSLGYCDYCDSEEVKCVEAWYLRDMFGKFLDLYHPLEVGVNVLPDDDPWDHGSSLGDLIDEEWEIFSDKFPSNRRDDLLDNIFNSRLSPKEQDISRVPVRDLWARSEEDFTHVGSTDLWNKFASHIKRERRFVFVSHDHDFLNGVSDPREWLPDFLEEIVLEMDKGDEVYRARREEPGHVTFHISEMGAPPAEKAAAGRANSAGIPVLYAASDQETAIAEVRPWKGATVSVARGVARNPMKVVDLSEIPCLLGGPFAYQFLTHEVDKFDMVQRLASQLAWPTSPHESEIEYVPTQYLTEVIKNAGFDGMLYPSAMGTGKNLVLFDPTNVEFVGVTYVKVTDVTYSSQPV